MLKAAVNDSMQELWFEQEVSEARAMDGHVGTLHLLLACGCYALRASLWLFIFFIIKQLTVNIILSHGHFLGQK